MARCEGARNCQDSSLFRVPTCKKCKGVVWDLCERCVGFVWAFQYMKMLQVHKSKAVGVIRYQYLRPSSTVAGKCPATQMVRGSGWSGVCSNCCAVSTVGAPPSWQLSSCAGRPLQGNTWSVRTFAARWATTREICAEIVWRRFLFVPWRPVSDGSKACKPASCILSCAVLKDARWRKNISRRLIKMEEGETCARLVD